MHNFLKEIRLKNNYTQEDIAKILGIARQSYSLLEKENLQITIGQIEKLSGFYNISKNDFINMRETNFTTNIIPENDCEKKENNDIRINIPQKNVSIFKEVFLYILSKIGAKPNVGETVLYKILYFIDFDYYEKYEEQLMGLVYIKNHHGPTPISFKTIIADMEKGNLLEKVKTKYFDKEQTKYLPIKESNLDCLTGTQKQHIDDILNKLSDKNATELSNLSHEDTPWIIADFQKEIDYESVFYRTDKTSVRGCR